jgi:hypothetical protein
MSVCSKIGPARRGVRRRAGRRGADSLGRDVLGIRPPRCALSWRTTQREPMPQGREHATAAGLRHSIHSRRAVRHQRTIRTPGLRMPAGSRAALAALCSTSPANAGRGDHPSASWQGLAGPVRVVHCPARPRNAHAAAQTAEALPVPTRAERAARAVDLSVRPRAACLRAAAGRRRACSPMASCSDALLIGTVAVRQSHRVTERHAGLVPVAPERRTAGAVPGRIRGVAAAQDAIDCSLQDSRPAAEVAGSRSGRGTALAALPGVASRRRVVAPVAT